MSLVWMTNFVNPYRIDHSPMCLFGQSWKDALESERRLYDSMTKGRPQATEVYTVEELEDMGMIGLYKEELLELPS